MIKLLTAASRRHLTLDGLAGLAFVALALAGLVWWTLATLEAARLNRDGVGGPDRLSARSKISITLPPGTAVYLGHAEFGQPAGLSSSPAKRHLRIEHDRAGGLWIARSTADKRLDLEFAPTAPPPAGLFSRLRERVFPSREKVADVLSDRFAIPTAAQGGRSEMRFGEARVQARTETAGGVEVLRVTVDGGGGAPERTYLVDMRGEARVDGGGAVAACPGVEVDIGGFGLSDGSAGRLVAIGGHQDCALERGLMIAPPGLPPDVEMEIRRNEDGRLYFVPVRVPPASDLRLTRWRGGSGAPVLLAESGAVGQRWPLNDAAAQIGGMPKVARFTVGRTLHGVDVGRDPNGIALVEVAPISKARLFLSALCAANPRPDAPEAEDCPDALQEQPEIGAGVVLTEDSERPGALQRLFGPPVDGHLTSGDQVVRWGLLAASVALALVARWPWAAPRIRGRRRDVAALPRRDRATVHAEARAYLLALTPTFAAALIALAPEWLGLAGALGLRPGDPGWSPLLLAASIAVWVIATLRITTVREGGWLLRCFWAVFIWIVAIGAVSMFTLSAEGPSDDWARHFVKHKLLVLDVLPVMVTASLTASLTTLRRRFGMDLFGRLHWFGLPLYIGVVIVAFLAWAFLGRQQGLAGFQPVEAGKFALLTVGAVFFAQLVLWHRRLARPRLPVIIVALLLGVVFLGALVWAPWVQHDMSPLIVVLLTGVLVASLTTIFAMLRILHSNRLDRRALRRVPMSWRPRRTNAGQVRGQVGFWTLIAVLFSAPLALLWFSFGPGVAMALRLDSWSWRATATEQINLISPHLNQGRGLVQQRFLSYADVRFDALEPEEVAPGRFEEPQDGSPRKVRYRDLGYQVLRSRAAVAYAPCGVRAEFGSWPLSLVIGRPFETAPFVASAKAAALPVVAPVVTSVDEGVYVGDCATPAQSAQARCAPRRLTAAIRPHCVPVVQFDFSATYLLSRHGLGAGKLLAMLQAAFVGLCFLAFWRLQLRPANDPVEAGVNQALSLIALGAGGIHLAQWLLSWSNTFGVLPVMGQPMTWLSAAGSHHLFAAMPGVLAILAAFRMSDSRAPHLAFGAPPRFF